MLGRTPLGQRSGFTLVELLLVISIIMVLISMLLPARSLIDMFIRNRTCESNLKSIHSIFSAYANLNHGKYPYLSRSGMSSYFAGKRLSDDPWTGLTNVKQLLHCGANDAIFFCPFDTAAEDPADWRRDTWKHPWLYSGYTPSPYEPPMPIYCVYIGYKLLIYAGWYLDRPFERAMLADGRYPIGNVNGDGDIPIVADLMHYRDSMTCYGWYHGGGVNPDQGKLDGLFNSDCNTLFNAGYVVHKSAKEFDSKHQAFGYSGPGYDRYWFALTR